MVYISYFNYTLIIQLIPEIKCFFLGMKSIMWQNRINWEAKIPLGDLPCMLEEDVKALKIKHKQTCY